MVVEKHQERIINDKKRKFRRPYPKPLNGVHKRKDKTQNNGSTNDSNSIGSNINEGYTVKDVAIVDNSVNDLSGNFDSKKDNANNFEARQGNNTKQSNNKDYFNANSNVNNSKAQTKNDNSANNSDNSRDQGRSSQNKNKNEKNYQLNNSSRTKQTNTKVQNNNKQTYPQCVNNNSNNDSNCPHQNNTSGNNYYNQHSQNCHYNNSSNNINNSNGNQTQYYNRSDRFNHEKRGGISGKMYHYQINSKKHYYNNNADYRKQVNNGGGSTGGGGNQNQVAKNRQQNCKSNQFQSANHQFKNNQNQQLTTSSPTRCVGNGDKSTSHTPCVKESVIEVEKNNDNFETSNTNSMNNVDNSSVNNGTNFNADFETRKVDSQTKQDSNSKTVGARSKNNNSNTSGKVRDNNKVAFNNNGKSKDACKISANKEQNSSRSQNVGKNECESKTLETSDDRKSRQQLNNNGNESKIKTKHENNSNSNYRGTGNSSTQGYNNHYYYNSNRNFGVTNNNGNNGSWKISGQLSHKQNYRYSNAKAHNNKSNSNYGNNSVHGKQVNNSNNVNKYQGEFESSYSAENKSYNSPAPYDDYKSKRNKKRYGSGGRNSSVISNNSTNNGDDGNNYNPTSESKDSKDEIAGSKGATDGNNALFSETNVGITDSNSDFESKNKSASKDDHDTAVVGDNSSREKAANNNNDAHPSDGKILTKNNGLGSSENKKVLLSVTQENGNSVCKVVNENRDDVDSSTKIGESSNSRDTNHSCNENSDNGVECAEVSGNGNSEPGSSVGLWRRTNQGNQVVDSLETVRRTVKSLLNKITVEKFPVIAEKLAVCIDNISNVSELEELVKQVLDKAITEPDFSEMYADLCQILKWRSPVLIKGDKVTMGFGKALLLKCEHEFKNLPKNMTPTDEERESYDSEEIELIYRKRKLHVLGIIRLIGELFIRRMFPMRSLNELVFDLVMTQEKPNEYAIECLCQLIMTTGYYLDSNEKSQMIVDQWFGRLKELQRTQISARLNCLIQDVFDLRKHKWVKKVHKQKAKALADIMKDIDVEDVLGGAAIAAQYGSVVVVGERSNLVGNSAYNSYMTSQEELYLSRQKNQQK
ncbi:eIF4G eukaryotic initiation factor 4 [Cryptosporidium ryanae]|uniref:eIF4G eukaryotic initiation factor 4 n=1 Tax=Cryptosporidium ryanae TaxID=515981 RepID=UPI00351A2DFC|nr:eIF4G eukaryotic initiation factor 4 [Cryptosporidium ryanae]